MTKEEQQIFSTLFLTQKEHLRICLYGKINRHVFRYTTVDDIIQDTFLDLMRSKTFLKSYVNKEFSESGLRAYIFRTARNLLKDKNSKLESKVKEFVDYTEVPFYCNSNPNYLIFSTLKRNKYIDILHDFFTDGKWCVDIEIEQGLKKSTVRSRFKVGMREIKDRMLLYESFNRMNLN